MASITNRPNGHKWVQFSRNGSRHTLRLGRVGNAAARNVLHHVEAILSCELSGEPLPVVTARWVGGAKGVLRERLARCGLAASSSRPCGLATLLKHCLEQYDTAKPNTRRNMTRVSNALLEFFGDAALESLTPGGAEDFRRSLRRQGLAETTVSEMCKKAKTLLGQAVNHRWLESNPFGRMRGWTRTDETRQHFVDRATIARVLDKCEPEWLLIVSLVRYGGLRCPSEVCRLRWEYVNLPAGRMTVESPKTAGQGKPFRVVPIFPELREHLEAAYDAAQPGAVYVVPRARGVSDKALYSAMLKRLARAGVEPWPKLFVNMRSSRQTELSQHFPAHVVCAWLGNTPSIAKTHYLQVTDDHFESATQPEAKPEAVIDGLS